MDFVKNEKEKEEKPKITKENACIMFHRLIFITPYTHIFLLSKATESLANTTINKPLQYGTESPIEIHGSARKSQREGERRREML